MEQISEVVSINEIAKILGCSKAHVYNAINGKIEGVTRIPAMNMGRRKIVRRASFEAWRYGNEVGQTKHAEIAPLAGVAYEAAISKASL